MIKAILESGAILQTLAMFRSDEVVFQLIFEAIGAHEIASVGLGVVKLRIVPGNAMASIYIILNYIVLNLANYTYSWRIEFDIPTGIRPCCIV